MNKKFILAAGIIFFSALAVYLVLSGNDKKAVKDAAERYINAVRDRNFTAVYELNADSQKRKLFILKNTGVDKKEDVLKKIYDEQRTSFDSVLPTFLGGWAEKFIFIPGMSYKVMNVVMEQDIENPTAFYVKRINATVEIEVEYLKKETAPVLEGRSVKKVNYLVKMIHSKNITRVIKDIIVDDRWLFKGIAVKQGSVVFW